MWSPSMIIFYLERLSEDQKEQLSSWDRKCDPNGEHRAYHRAMIGALDRAIKSVQENSNPQPAPWMTALHYLLLTASMAAIASMFIYAAS